MCLQERIPQLSVRRMLINKAQNDVDTNGQNYANANGICPIPVYVSISLGTASTVFNENCMERKQNVNIRFYSDAAKTIPYNVTNLVIQVRRGTTVYTNGVAAPTTYVTTNYTCSGNLYTLTAQLTMEGCASDCPNGTGCLPAPSDPQTQYSYALVTSTFYVMP